MVNYEETEDDFNVANEDTSSKKTKNIKGDVSEKPIVSLTTIKVSVIVVLILAVVSAVTVFMTNDYFKKYRNNFMINLRYYDSKLGISEGFKTLFSGNDGDLIKKREENKAMGTTYDNETYLIPFEGASNAKFVTVPEGIVVAKANYLACLNDKGQELWAINTSVNNPILSVEGKYISLAENGGTKVCLYSDGKLIYETDSQNLILNSGLSSEGDVVVVTKKEFFKGAVEAYNNKGERIFSWSSGTDTIMCADISPSSRRIAVGFLDTKNQITGSVQLFEVDSEESYKKVEIPGSVVYKLLFVGETLNVIGDNRIVGLSVHGDVIWDEGIDGEFSAYAIDSEGHKAAVVDRNNVPTINVYHKKGDLQKEISTDELPDYVDVNGRYVLFNNTRMVLFGKGNNFAKYAATMDINSLKIVNSDVYLIVYNNSLEFVHV